jgi:hypothetical protein
LQILSLPPLCAAACCRSHAGDVGYKAQPALAAWQPESLVVALLAQWSTYFLPIDCANALNDSVAAYKLNRSLPI